MEGFKHDGDWQTHPYGCDCDLCYAKFLERIRETFAPEVSESKPKEN